MFDKGNFEESKPYCQNFLSQYFAEIYLAISLNKAAILSKFSSLKSLITLFVKIFKHICTIRFKIYYGVGKVYYTETL